ncbi:MAG: YbaK/EbsC family protein [Betaproteobacteria bacterium]|nr:YbaK/EbsC family protein [Betaproteobacteria bacterium]
MNSAPHPEPHPDFAHPAIVRVRDALAAHGLIDRIRLLTESTHTSQAAADHLGCDVGEIAKSVIFRAKESDRPVLVIASGRHRVDEKRVAAALGEALGKADAEFVKARTGFVIGGVAPVGHLETPICFIDRQLCEYSQVWAAAGLPNSLFHLTPGELLRIAPGAVIDVAKAA